MLFDFFRKREIDLRNIDRLPPIHAPTGDQTCNLGMCPDQGSSLQHFGAWDYAPTNTAAQSGLYIFIFNWFVLFPVWGFVYIVDGLPGICLQCVHLFCFQSL